MQKQYGSPDPPVNMEGSEPPQQVGVSPEGAYDPKAGLRREVDYRFTYHPPRPDQIPLYETIRSVAGGVARTLVSTCPPSHELDTALTRLEEAVFWANAAIARRG